MGDSPEAAGGGDADAAPPLEQALQRCLPGLRAWLQRQTRNLDATQELVQDVLLIVWEALREGRLRDPGALPAYTLQCARHTVMAYQRRVRPLSLAEALPEAVQLWAQAPVSPLQLCEESELRRLAMEVLAELPAERDRQVIRGYYMDGLDKSQLLQRLGLDSDHFDRVISRARTRMRERLHKKLQPELPDVGGMTSL